LTNLKGSPKIVRKDFYCTDNKLINLEGASEVVEGSFTCSGNYNLISLKGAPKIVKKNFYCSYVQLTSLDYLPKTITTPEKLISDFSEEEVYEFFRNNRPEVLI
jgi:hypothetical protein